MIEPAYTKLKSPYPWFGGKSKIMPMIWERFGVVRNFVDPFGGSMASVLSRPLPFDGLETVNDANPMVGNFWRCLQRDPLTLALEADHPIEESWLHSNGDAIFYRDDWYAARGLESREAWKTRMDQDSDYCNYEIAGIWVQGLCQWIGDNWSARAPARVCRSLPHLGDAGRGVARQRPHLGDAGQAWLSKLSYGPGLIELLEAWPAVTERTWMLFEYFAQLAARFRSVRVCVGDWTRVLGDAPTVSLGTTAIMFDPPYAIKSRDSVYGAHDDFTVAHDVRRWCIEKGDNKNLRIALCGYEEHDELSEHGWDCMSWKTQGGYSNASSRGKANAAREQVWFSPHCVKEKSMLFA